MRYKLLHYGTFVPVISRVLVDPWGLKVCWLFYLFCTYLLLERRCWNGYELKTWIVLQRSSETCLMLCLSIAANVSPWLAPCGFLALHVRSPWWLRHALCCFSLVRLDVCQLCCVGALLLSESAPRLSEWHGAVLHRLVTRCVQVTVLVLVYQSWWHQLTLLCFVFALKALSFLVPCADQSMANAWDGSLPVCLVLNIHRHRC